MSSSEYAKTTSYQFDPRDAEVVENPGKAYSELRARCPFHHVKDDKLEFWITSDYDEIKNHVLKDNPVTDWTFKYGNSLVTYAYNTGIVTDMPEHAFWRSFLGQAVAPKPLQAMRPKIEALTNSLLDNMLEKSHGELHHDYALPTTGKVMCMLLGAPLENYELYKHMGDELMIGNYHETEGDRTQRVFKELSAHFAVLVKELRQKLKDAGITEPAPEHVGKVIPEGYLSKCITHKVDGRYFTDMEIFNMCATFLTGGQETSTSLIMNCTWRLLQNRELWEQVVANPDLVEIAVEESLRFDPPVLCQFRTSTRPLEMHGQQLPEKAKLMWSIAGANRDPDIFENPDEFRLDRPLATVRKHLAFGAGMHQCIGAALGRMDAQIAMRGLATRLPKLRLIGDGAADRVLPWMNWGRTRLDVAWD